MLKAKRIRLKKVVFLTNTDTTIGFISKSKKALDIAKNRTPNKVYIEVLPSLKALRKRVPKKYKKLVRRAKKTTFILNQTYSFRVSYNNKHNLLLNRLNGAYSSSANESNKNYDYNYAYKNADIIIYPLGNKNKPSKIYKLSSKKIKKIR